VGEASGEVRGVTSPRGIPQFDLDFFLSVRRNLLEKISRLTDPEDERRFREWVTSLSAQQPGERVQGTRDYWRAEWVTDQMIKYQRERERRVKAQQRALDRLEMVLSGEVGYIWPSRAVNWCLEARREPEDPPPRGGGIGLVASDRENDPPECPRND